MWYTDKKLSMNMPLYDDMGARFSDQEDLEKYYRALGLNGVEVILADHPEKAIELIRPGTVNGQHLYFSLFWVDWWRRDFACLNQMFGSRSRWMDYYGGADREKLLDIYRKELAFARDQGAAYVVFHVSEASLQESFSFRFSHTDREVMEASLEVINLLLDEEEYPFDFLVENLWWPGLNLRDTGLTAQMLEGIHTDRKGIMLDTGHYMNAVGTVHTEAEGVACLMELADVYERAGLLSLFKGVHLHQSLSGSHIQALRRGEIPCPELDFDALFSKAYENTCIIDEHRPFETGKVVPFLEKINPRYITFEFQQYSREAYARQADTQRRALGLPAR